MLEPALERLKKQIQGLREEGFSVGPTTTEEEVRLLEQRLGVTFPEDYRGFLIGGMQVRPLHGFGLNPFLTEQEVALFEHQWGVTLPEEYRAFLTQAGNGEKGAWEHRAGIGLYPLQYAAREVDPEDLAIPFPVPRTLEEAGRLACGRRWGCLPIAEEGSGIVTQLIVTGSERGNIWTGLQELIPWPPPGSRAADYQHWNEWAADLLSPANTYPVGFLPWYESWLQERMRSPQWGFNLEPSFAAGPPPLSSDPSALS